MVIMVFEEKEIEIADEISDWSHVLVCENGEKLVKIPNRNSPRLLAENKYYMDILPGAVDGIWVRYTLLNMLEIASKMLPDNLKLLVWDGWRPTIVQMHLCQKAIAAFAVDGAKTNSSQEVVKYAANPKDVANKIPPHATGGAVDVCLWDSNEQMVEMGTPLDYFGSEAATAHFEKKRERRKLTEDELDNRN